MKPASLTSSTAVVATEAALSTTIDGETVILHPDVGKYYGLNNVGTFVWKQLEEPRTIEAICEEVTDEYDVESQRCEDDVSDLISDMAAKGLVQLAET